MKDLVIAPVTGYTYEQIEPWVVSLERSGFEGHKAVIAYNMDANTVEKLTAKGFRIFAFKQEANGGTSYPIDGNFNVVVERFAHLYYFLSQLNEPIRQVILTDIKDVIFQSNPSEWLDELLINDEAEILVSNENIRYRDEPWGRNNLTQSFGHLMYERLKDSPIVCAGVIAGSFHTMIDLCLNVFMLCRGSRPHIDGGGGPDQAALNIILSMSPWNDVTAIAYASDNWTIHAGTTLAACLAGAGGVGQYQTLGDFYKQLLLDPEPDMIGDKVCNHMGEPYVIVHQYNRVPLWNDIINKKYRE